MLEGPYYSTVCAMPVFAASLAAFRCDIISVNGSRMVVMRTYRYALGDTRLFLEWLWVEYMIISIISCVLAAGRTSLASTDSALKYTSNSEARPWPPGCCAFQCIIQTFL